MVLGGRARAERKEGRVKNSSFLFQLEMPGKWTAELENGKN